MDRKELTAYVKHIYELEASVYQQMQLTKKIERELALLPQKPQINDREAKLIIKLSFAGIAVALILYIINAVVWYFTSFRTYLDLKETSPELFTNPPDWLTDQLFFTGFTSFGLLFFSVGTFFLIIFSLALLMEKKVYRKQLTAYSKAQPYRDALNTELSTVQAKLAETEAMLEEFYNIPDEDDDHYIQKPFRDFIAIAHIYQLLDFRQESTLPRCYDRYQEAVYRNEVITILSAILQNLNQIRITQSMLYQAVSRSNEINEGIYEELVSLNQTGTQISGNLSNMERSTQLLAHNSELARQESEYRRYLENLKNR